MTNDADFGGGLLRSASRQPLRTPHESTHPETNAVALLGAYAACETLLGLVAGVRRYKQGDD